MLVLLLALPALSVASWPVITSSPALRPVSTSVRLPSLSPVVTRTTLALPSASLM